ncbi:MAG TPA: transglycosylase domain-containing protein, partial [Solirubrobacteraceae bacterium]|nr:transglycosylase domain-containing protein [Solirubrobacteraceae bacterium]
MSDANGSDNVTPLFEEPPAPRPKLRKLRLFVVLVPLSLLALVSTVFGMMMAVASDLPDLENRKEFQDARNSVLYDVHGKELGVLTNNQSRVIVSFDQISPDMRSAIIAIEDRRFYRNPGVDIRGIARAFVQDVIQQRAVQGGSTITQQFVKNAMRAQNERTVFQKLREAALAYHLTRKWSKQKILTQYLNSIYFGNGAYGIESAARTYFGRDHPECPAERPCATVLRPHEAALIAAIVANPSAYDPVANPAAAKRRRDLVLQRMFEQGRLGRLEYFNARQEALPADPEPPRVRTKAPYFTTWVRQQLVDRYGARRAFEGGLKVTTTLDLDLQNVAEATVKRYFANPSGPAAAIVAIDNDSGEVRAMVGGRNYNARPFNLATQGRRQPGSAMKPFILAEALRQGIDPGSVWPSRKRFFSVPGSKTEKFVVNNFENRYSGTNTLAGALTASDNAVYAAVGIHVGTRKVARLARRMGIRTPVSSNLAMTLGGLREGVTPLDMAHAYETFATDGLRVTGTLGASRAGPVGVRSVATLPRRGRSSRTIATNRLRRRRVLDKATAQTAVGIMQTVVTRGTGKRAGLADGSFVAGKTGTTENSGDAWFVGFSDRMTVAVWVGYPDKLKPMLTEFGGKPVEGGTFPALIWHDFMTGANRIIDDRNRRARIRRGLPPEPPESERTTTTAPAPPPAVAPAAPAEGGDVPPPPSRPVSPSGGGTTAPPPSNPAPPAAPAPQPTTPAPAPAPTPSPAPTPT